MKNQLITLLLAIMVAWGFSSCESCVKKTTKKVTKIGISAIEGVTEAVDEKGEDLAEKTTNAAGKLIMGMGKSLDKQLEEHATRVASVTGRTSVQLIEGLAEGLDIELKSFYYEIPYEENFPSGVTLDLFAKYKNKELVDAYFIIEENGKYLSKFECYDEKDNLFMTKEIDINNTIDSNNRDGKYTLVSFAPDTEEELGFNNLKYVKITVTKEK